MSDAPVSDGMLRDDTSCLRNVQRTLTPAHPCPVAPAFSPPAPRPPSKSEVPRAHFSLSHCFVSFSSHVLLAKPFRTTSRNRVCLLLRRTQVPSAPPMQTSTLVAGTLALCDAQIQIATRVPSDTPSVRYPCVQFPSDVRRHRRPLSRLLGDHNASQVTIYNAQVTIAQRDRLSCKALCVLSP